MQRLVIDRMTRKQYEGKNGPYTRLSIKSGARWLSAFEGEWNRHWREGMEIEVEVNEVPGKDRKGNSITYYNIQSPPRQQAAPQANTKDIHAKLDLIIGMLKGQFPDEEPPVPSDDEMPPEPEEGPVPF